MKHQKSAIPYLILLGFILIGLPMLERQVQGEHKLKIEIVPMDSQIEYAESEPSRRAVAKLTAVYK